jgi:hypothetical protein
MRISFWGRFGALVAALLGSVGLYFESTPFLVLASVAAVTSVFYWARSTAPHDHWGEFRRRMPWDP